MDIGWTEDRYRIDIGSTQGEVHASWTANPITTPAYKSPAHTYTGQYSYSIPFRDMDDPTSGVAEGPSTGSGQRFGLMFYHEASRAALRRVDNARWYDPAIGRFAQADSVIPEETQGTQAWDRYAFVNNNPVRYNDPTGHSLSALTWTLLGVTAAIAVAAAVVFAAPAVVATLAVAAAATPGVGIGVVSALATASFAPEAALTALGVAGLVTGSLAAVSAGIDTDVDSAAQSSVNATQSSINATQSAPSATPTPFQPPASTATSIPTTTPNGTVTATPNIVTATPGTEAHIVPDTPTPCGYGALEGTVCP